MPEHDIHGMLFCESELRRFGLKKLHIIFLSYRWMVDSGIKIGTNYFKYLVACQSTCSTSKHVITNQIVPCQSTSLSNIFLNVYCYVTIFRVEGAEDRAAGALTASALWFVPQFVGVARAFFLRVLLMMPCSLCSVVVCFGGLLWVIGFWSSAFAGDLLLPPAVFSGDAVVLYLLPSPSVFGVVFCGC